jgi:adenine-specific DNA-methyltransferase
MGGQIGWGHCLLPKENQQFLKRIEELGPLACERAGGASRLVFTILYVWQYRSFPVLVRSGTRPNKDLAKDIRVIQFAEWLAQRDFFDAAFWLSSAYAAWVGESVRKKYAMYFTPPNLSARLIENLLDNGASLTGHAWMDPACGGAAFLAPVAQRMAKELRARNTKPKEALIHIASHLVGNDVDPDLACLSKQFLRMSLYNEIVEAGFEPSFRIGTADALLSLKRQRAEIDVVICNPPYRKMKGSEVAGYAKDYNDVIVGQPNLYTLFFKLALSLLKEDCIGGLLTPTSFLSGRYFSPLRTYLLENADTLQLDIVQERVGVFVAAELDTAMSILRKREPGKNCASETRVFVFRGESGFTNVGRCKLPNSGTSWPIPRSKADFKILRSINGSTFHLEDYGYQARVGAFVWNRDKRKTFHTKRAASKAATPFPLIWSSNIRQNGRFRFEGSLYGEHRQDMYIDMGRDGHGSVIRRPAIGLQRVTSSDQARRLVAAPISNSLIKEFGGVVGENHVVFLEQTESKPKLSPSQLAMVLRSDWIDRLFRCISGAVNVSVFELGQLPLPDPDVLGRLMRRGVPVNKAVRAAFRAKRRTVKSKKNG